MKCSGYVSGIGMTVAMAGIAHAGPIQFEHLKSIELSTLFSPASAVGAGEDVGDVAFDGTNAYVAGYKVSGGAGTVGVLRITDVLGAHAIDSSALVSVSNSAGGGRDSKLVYHDNSLYFAYGLGETSTTTTGVRKYRNIA